MLQISRIHLKIPGASEKWR